MNCHWLCELISKSRCYGFLVLMTSLPLIIDQQKIRMGTGAFIDVLMNCTYATRNNRWRRWREAITIDMNYNPNNCIRKKLTELVHIATNILPDTCKQDRRVHYINQTRILMMLIQIFALAPLLCERWVLPSPVSLAWITIGIRWQLASDGSNLLFIYSSSNTKYPWTSTCSFRRQAA